MISSLSSQWKLFKSNPVSFLGEVVQSLIAANDVNSTLPSNIDGAYLLDRILVVGPARVQRSEKNRFENDAAVLSEFLWRSHGKDKVMHFDLAPRKSHLDAAGLGNAVVQFEMHRPTLKVLREAVDAIVGWLNLDEKNVAVLTCSNGALSFIACTKELRSAQASTRRCSQQRARRRGLARASLLAKASCRFSSSGWVGI